MRLSRSTLAVLALLARLGFSQDVEFFYTETLDLCDINGVSIQANEQTTHGGICAYRNDVDIVYACPSPDDLCWTWAEDCNDSGVGQTICNRGGTAFCCNAVAGDTCTTTEGQINVCISNFTSPNSGVDVNTANEAYQKAIGVTNVTATSQVTDPTPFSTRNLVSTSSPLPTTSTSSTSLTTSSASSISSAASSSTSGVTNSPVTEDKSGISGGAIAGIVIGALAVIAIIGGAFFLLGRRRRNNNPVQPDSKAGSEAGFLTQGFETKHASGYQHIQPSVSELGHESNARVEMPVSYSSYPNGKPQQAHEMP